MDWREAQSLHTLYYIQVKEENMSRQVKRVNISSKEDKSNKVSSWSNPTADTHYPSEKLVKDSLDGKANSTHNHTKSQITDFPTIPSASSTVPSADTTNGSYGSGTNYARSNHTHPKSSLYAESSHTHSQYLTEHQSLTNYVQKSGTRGLLKNDGSVDTTQYLSSLPSHNHDDRYYTESEVDTALNGKANSSHTHTKSQITDFPTSMTPTSHTHGNLQNNGQVGSTAQANKNVVTNSSGLITTEDKPTIPSASSTTPSADTTSGSVGTGTTWARSNHSHPKSSLYAESSHNHTKSQITDFPSIPSKTSDLQNDSGFLTSHQDISGKIDTAGTGLSKSGTTLNHSNSITAQTTNALKKIKYDSQGHITGSADVTASDLPTHTHSQYLTEHQSLDSKTVTVEKQSSAESGYAHTYVVKQNGSQVGVKINIPKDFLVKSATVKTVTTVNNPVSGYVVGDKYLDFVVNSKDNSATDEHLYVLVSDLVDTEIEWNNIQNKPTLFSGSYADLTNKPSYTPTITSNTNGAYKIGSINISGSNVDIYGKDTDTHQDISGKENISNKTSSWNATTNHTRYPTEKLVKDSLDLKANSSDLSTVATTGDYDDLLNTPEELCIVDFYYDSTTDELVLNTCSDQDLANITDKEDKSNKVATWSTTPNHIHYPTEKLVKDYIDDMIGDIIDYIEG